MSFYVGPFQRIAAFHLPETEVPTSWWRIAKNTSRPDLDSDYSGQGEGVASHGSGTAKSHRAFEGTDIYTDLGVATAALADLAGSDEFGRGLYRIDQDTDMSIGTTAEPVASIALSDARWVLAGSADGWLPYSWEVGRFSPGVPDPACPPFDFVILGEQASEATALNYRTWQVSLSGGSSWTLLHTPFMGTGTELYCLPG